MCIPEPSLGSLSSVFNAMFMRVSLVMKTPSLPPYSPQWKRETSGFVLFHRLATTLIKFSAARKLKLALGRKAAE